MDSTVAYAFILTCNDRIRQGESKVKAELKVTKP